MLAICIKNIFRGYFFSV